VVVCEVDPVRALEAVADGFAVMPLADAAAVGDFFVTSTGTHAVFGREHFERMKDGAVLANAGGLDTEIDVPALEAMAKDVREARRQVTEYRLPDGRRLHLLAEGRLVNIAGGDGHPVEIMDLSFSVQALSVHHLARHAAELAPGVHALPAEIDDAIARRRLDLLGMRLEEPTPEQLAYARTWR
jgi:adenosylhomocysteinase